MESNDKTLIKIAQLIREKIHLLRLHRYGEVKRLVYVLGDGLKQLQRVHKLLEDGLNRNWTFAATKLTGRIESQLRDLPHSIEETQRMITSTKLDIPSLKQIVAELMQLQDEFPQVECDYHEQTISTVSEPIELEGIHLGEFEIKLDLAKFNQMQDSSAFRIIALEPHPAAGNDIVTHPHVSDEYLCAGDAAVPMLAALSNGRICDAFLLIKSVLENYNPSSPYVSLSDWYGITCNDCGYTTNEEDSYYCESCGSTTCDECYSYCNCCEITRCRGCLSECPACEDLTCQSCLSPCAQCEKSVCTSCLDENLCPSCKEEMENSVYENETNESENDDDEDQQVA